MRSLRHLNEACITCGPCFAPTPFAPNALSRYPVITPKGNAHVARVTDKHVCPRCKVVTPIVKGSHSSTCDNLPIARVGDKTACGATIVRGSSMATADGKPVAYLGSTTTHGGVIITGSGTCKVMP